MIRHAIAAVLLATPAVAAEPISGRYSMFIIKSGVPQEEYEQIVKKRLDQLRAISPHVPDRFGNYKPIPEEMKAPRHMFNRAGVGHRILLR